MSVAIPFPTTLADPMLRTMTWSCASLLVSSAEDSSFGDSSRTSATKAIDDRDAAATHTFWRPAGIPAGTASAHTVPVQMNDASEKPAYAPPKGNANVTTGAPPSVTQTFWM